jgi:hypothetical protein
VGEACEVAARRRLFPHALAVAAVGDVRVEVAKAYAEALAAERRYEAGRCRLTPS